MTSNNIVLFPPSRIANASKTALHSKKVPKSVKEIKDIVHLLKVEKIDQIMDVMTPLIANGLDAYGITVTKKNEIKQCAFMFESLRSMLYNHFKLGHPIQLLAENLLRLENGKLTVQEINVVLKKDEDK